MLSKNALTMFSSASPNIFKIVTSCFENEYTDMFKTSQMQIFFLSPIGRVCIWGRVDWDTTRKNYIHYVHNA